MHNALVSCKAGYDIVNKQAVYTYCSTNGGTGTLRTAQNGGGNEVSCEQQFYELYAGEFNEGTTQIFYSSGNYNMKYLKVRYGIWWAGFCLQRTCSNTYNAPENGNGNWTLNVGNGICGDPVPYCGKKAQVWVGYCLRGHCF